MLNVYFELKNIDNDLTKIALFGLSLGDDALDWFLDYLDTHSNIKAIKYSNLIHQPNESFSHLGNETAACRATLNDYFYNRIKTNNIRFIGDYELST